MGRPIFPNFYLELFLAELPAHADVICSNELIAIKCCQLAAYEVDLPM
jgi:hypothetical protein